MSNSTVLRALGLLLAAACSESKTEAPGPGRAPEPPFNPPVAEYADPQPLPVPEWRAAAVTGQDLVLAQLFDGSFTYPDVGPRDGLNWEAAYQAMDGSLGTWGGNYVYVAALLTFDEPTRLVVRTDRTVEVFHHGAVQPGDIYGSGKIRVPLLADAGDNVVVLRGLAGREISAQLWTTPDELHANLDDRTVPDLIEGDASGLYVGVPVLNLTDASVLDVEARILDSDHFEQTTLWRPALAPASVTQLSFRLSPKGPAPAAGTKVPVTVEVRAPSLEFAYRRTFDLDTVAPDARFRRTFLSPDDGSTQYYGVVPPSDFDPAREYGLILSLHGAGVEGIGQAGAYSAQDWAYVVAATNRRPFGFDWEEWGHANAIFALDDATAHFAADPTRIHLAGHSMGGHGTWHVGLMHPGRFAVISPSAGWESFYSYTGTPRPSYPHSRARAHSDTLDYISNIARRGVYIIHGDLDDNVPVSHGRTMFAEASAVSDDVVYHEQAGAGHWWDGDASPGADCVDWPPMMDMMEDRRLDPYELDFEFRSPSPAYTPSHSFVTLESATSPMEDLVVASLSAGSTVALTTTNVRSMSLDGAALLEAGVTEAIVDGESHDVTVEPLWIGPRDGKRRELYGTYNQVFHRPFCFVYPDGDGPYARYASYLVSDWSVIGNGQACALPLSALTARVREHANLVYLGIAAADLGSPDVPFDWSGDTVDVDIEDRQYDAGLMFVFPSDGRLAALLATPPGRESLLWRIVPFSSRSGLPDYMIWDEGGAYFSGFFDNDWQYDPDLRAP